MSSTSCEAEGQDVDHILWMDGEVDREGQVDEDSGSSPPALLLAPLWEGLLAS